MPRLPLLKHLLVATFLLAGGSGVLCGERGELGASNHRGGGSVDIPGAPQESAVVEDGTEADSDLRFEERLALHIVSAVASVLNTFIRDGTPLRPGVEKRLQSPYLRRLAYPEALRLAMDYHM